MTATAETKKNAAHEFLAYQTRMAEGVLADVIRLAKQIESNANELSYMATFCSVKANSRPTPNQIQDAAHLARACAEYGAKLAELAAMQKSITDLNNGLGMYAE